MKIKDWLYKVSLYNKTNKYIYNECFIFLKFILKKNRIWIELNINLYLKYKYIEYLNLFLIKRLRGEPISYILNKCYFLNISFKIYYDIFIPRLSTECMINFLIKLIKCNNLKNILDLGAGSGIITYLISRNCINTNIYSIDNNILSINLIKYNCKKLNLLNVFVLKSNWFSKIKKKINFFDLIVSNPPYIWNKDNCLNKGDLRFESYKSLVSDQKGLKDIIYIIKSSFNYLNNKGWLVLEHSLLNFEKIIYLFNKYFFNVYTYKDIYINYRFTIGQKLVI